MPSKELCEDFGGKQTKAEDALPRAIRALCIGGDEALDLKDLLNSICSKLGHYDHHGNPTLARQAYRKVCSMIDKFDDQVRDKYDMPAR